MAKASNDPETDAWIQEYRRNQAARAGRSFIDGRPSEEVLGMDQATLAARNPVLPAPGVPAVTPEQADRVMANVEVIGAQRANEQMLDREDRLDRYNRFLLERGINPNKIGAATVRDASGDRMWDNPSLPSQEAAVNAQNAANAAEGRARIAARRAYRTDPMAWAALTNEISNQRRARGGNNASQVSDYWYNRIMGAYPFRQNFMNSSNGFGY